MYKIYYTRKEHSLWTIHDLFNELSLYLNENYNSEIITQFGGHVYVKEFDYHIGDCEIILYDEINDILKVVSYSETKTSVIDIIKKRNNKNDTIVVLHQPNWGGHLSGLEKFNFTLKQTTFYPFSPKVNYEYFYHIRKLKKQENLIDKIFFKTTTGRGDEQKLIESGLINLPFNPIPFEEYLEMSINYKIGLSISGSGYELCHRDFDCMSVGLPLMRLELIGKYEPELIPNYHYISINRGELGNDVFMDLKGGDKYIELYKKRFMEVKDDYKFLNFISKNAFDYFKENSSPENRLRKLLNILNIN
jgi:hypothetical protein